MRVDLGDNIRSSDGRDIGQVHKVILDTRRCSVSGLVLRQGGLLHKDFQVALTEVRDDPAEGLILTYSSDIIRDMPAYKPPGAGGAVERADVAVMLAQYELEHAVIGAGSPVKGRDGRKVGAVHRLAFELPSGRLTRLTIHRGLLVVEEIEVPIDFVAAAAADELDLTVTADEIDALAKLRPGLDVYTSDDVCLGSIVARSADHLEVSGVDGRHPLFVPLGSVARVEADRALLTTDSGHAAFWGVAPTAGAPTESEPPAV
jgi:sporulation protein YlmC with PRC-barrel domain